MSSDDRLVRIDSEELQAIREDPLVLELRDDVDEVVPAIPSQAFVGIARQLLEEGRLDLVLPHALPDQLTALLDLDAWRNDRLEVPTGRGWLLAVADAYEEAARPRGALTGLMLDMDGDMWTLLLVGATAVAELDPEDDQSRQLALEGMAALQTWETPDGFYILGVPDHELGRATVKILQAMYDDDLIEAGKLVRSIKWAMASPLEEEQLRWRKGRLADMGFPDWEDAMRLFKPMARDAALGEPTPPRHELTPEESAALSVRWAGSFLLRSVMSRLDGAEHGVRTREFLLLVNELMAALRYEPGEESQQEAAVRQAQATVSLGLAMLASQFGDADDDATIDALVDRVRAIGLRGMFRVGYAPLAKLRRAAQALHRTGKVSLASPGSLLDRPWGLVVAPLLRWYPELALESGSGTRPLTTLEDVARATRLLAEADALTRLCFDPAGFGVDPVWVTRVDEPERLTLGDLVRTAVVKRLRAQLDEGADPAFGPIERDDLAWAHEHLLRDGALRQEARGRFEQACADVGATEQAEALTTNLLTRLAMELRGVEFVDDGSPDLTRTGGMLTVQSVSVWLKTAAG